MKEQTVTLKTTASKARLQANTLWVNTVMARKVNVTEDSELQNIVSLTVVGNTEPQPILLMTNETAETLYEELKEVLGIADL